MSIQNKFLYRLTDRLGTIAVVPLGEGDFTLEYERQNDHKLSYKKQLSGKIVFTGEAFKRILQMENSVYRCDEQTLTILKVCNNVERIYFVGKVSMNEAEFNLDKCQVTLKYSEDKTDKCIDDGKNIKLNLFQLIWNRITVKTASYLGTIQTQNCFTGTHNQESDYWCGTGDPYDQNWTLVSYNVYSPDGKRNFVKNVWKREIIEIDCSDTPDPSWVLVEDNCGTTGKKKFARGVTLFDCVATSQPEDENGSYKYTMDCKVLGYDGGTTVIDNGMHFSEVMKEILKGACPNLTLKSDFFQINPDNPSSINYVTGKTSTVKDIVVFQKSDVKRPTASGKASKLEIELETMLEILLKMFNVKWRIEGNIFRLEHVSYYSKSVGFDVTSNALKKYFVGKRIYSYESSQIPQKETWKFKEQQGSDWNLEITYLGCVTNAKKNEVSNVIDEAMTDITFALQNPDKDSKLVEDTGFCLVSTKKIGSEYYINSESLSGGQRLNNVFSWVALIRDYHYYERPMKVGKVNGVTTQFITTIPTKKGERFAIPYNFCAYNFNPDDFVKTALGNGIVSSAKHRFKDYFLELELLYESNQDLVPNAPPTLSGGGTFSTYQETPLTLNVVANDPDGTISGLQVVIPPYHGNVTILSNSQIVYTPNAGFTGFDFFHLRALDNFSEVSNTEIFIINVYPPSQPPVANGATYTVYTTEPFFQGTSILANDSDDYGFTLVTTSTTTAQGVAITISPTGFFNYTPPNGFEGQDSFNYTIQNNAGLQATGTVILNVIDKNKPIAVEDNYQTLINTAFTSNGTLGREKLTENDYTPNGQTYTYTTTAETKPTTAGGSVTINGDGSFTYTPPSGFTGVDTFNYTVHNPNGSQVGLAKVSVVPMIYVKLTTSNHKIQGGDGYPVWTKSMDYTLNFYSDSGATIPFNVNGLNFRVKIKEHYDVRNGNSSFQFDNIYLTSVLTGTSTKILEDFQWFEQYKDYGYIQKQTITITIEPFTYTII